MPTSTQLYSQLLEYFRQYSRFKDIGHLQTLVWMVNAQHWCRLIKAEKSDGVRLRGNGENT